MTLAPGQNVQRDSELSVNSAEVDEGLSREAYDGVNGLLEWRSVCPEQFIENLGRLIREVVKVEPDRTAPIRFSRG
jgi:hypothetical protein